MGKMDKMYKATSGPAQKFDNQAVTTPAQRKARRQATETAMNVSSGFGAGTMQRWANQARAQRINSRDPKKNPFYGK